MIAAIAWIGSSFYFVAARPVAALPEGRRRPRGRGRRRALGGARRRLLPRAEVPGGAAGAARPPGLVQVGGLCDLALGLRPDGRPLLPECEHLPGRHVRCRPLRLGGGRDQRRDARGGVDRLRRPLPCPRRPRAPARRLHLRSHSARGLGIERALRAAGCVPAGRRNARDDDGGQRPLQHHPSALGADPRQRGRPGSRPGARNRRQAPVGPQQLPHAPGALHDARRALRLHVRRRPRLARAPRLPPARCLGPTVLQPAPPGQDALVDSCGRRRGRGRPRVLVATRHRGLIECRHRPVRPRAVDRRRAMRAVSRAQSDAGGLREPARRRPAGDAERDRRPGPADPDRRRDQGDAAQQPDQDDPGRTGRADRVGRAGARNREWRRVVPGTGTCPGTWQPRGRVRT